ncbi:hypothetical protein TRFO_40531 [Tritrichomonas foetus]|uniref:Proteasome component Ecm29 N-terminal domain-containing protein n=1 Tax=Tritrichomonas foetus TaxID=1144522 RepID=A0A1J4J0G8_9EUKA|nr:hypothetical protein TRFO_40531 [Tritrichomonas foetus]|eukprot:OHS93142.1 hypothetical protein TRFO_40531 [Tritrichomonas foetus]
MESESQLDLVLLSIYNAATPERLQSLITKYVPLLLLSLDPKYKFDQKKIVKTINDTLVFVRKRNELTLPNDELINILKTSKIPLQKNVTAVFLKISLQKHPEQIDLQELMNGFSTIPANIQNDVFIAYISQIARMDPIEFIKTLQKHTDSLLKLSSDQLSNFPSFLSSNIRLFRGYPHLFYTIFMKFDNIDIDDGSVLDGESIVAQLDKDFNTFNVSQIKRTFYLLSKLNAVFPLEKIVTRTDLPYCFECLDRQLPLQKSDVIEPHISHLVAVLTEKLYEKVELKISILRTLLKKCHKSFIHNLGLFKTLFSSDDIPRATKSSIIYLFSSFIDPSMKLLNYLENKIYDGDVTALSILRQIYPFSEPRTKVIACLMISDVNFTDECRLLLHPYRLSENDGFRMCLTDDKAETPTTAELFKIIENDNKIYRYLTSTTSTRNVSAIFNFATLCKPVYPLPYDFIIHALDNCPNSANEISAFLVHISNSLPKDSNFNPKPLLEFIEKETDASIIESISRFLRWSGVEIDVEQVTKKMNGVKKVAFMAHFGCPFDECVKMLTTAGQSNLGKNCLMAMAQRGLLDKSHFDKLFPTLSKDATGVEILSTIAASDVELCEQLTAKFFEVPLINSEHIELIVSGARKLSKIVNEKFLVDLIETGMKNDKSRRNSSIFLLYLVDRLVPERLWFTARTLLFCCGAENGVVRTSGLIGLNILYRKANESQKKEIDDALLGRSKPENENAQLMSGQSRSQLIQQLLKLAPNIPTFLDFLINLIEPDFLIFSGIDIPKAENSKSGSEFSSKFFYCSFSPNETTADSFRRLWRWATDGGKKQSIPDLINAIDEDATSWDAQQQNLSCVHEIISRMSQEQTAEFFEKLTAILMKLVFSPVKEMTISGTAGLDKLVQKLGTQNLSKHLQNTLISLCAQLFDTRQPHLVIVATKWANDVIPSVEMISDMIVIYKALFAGLGATPQISEMLSGPTWPVFSKAVYRCCELELHPFMDFVKDQLRSMIVLDSQRYAAYYALDSIFRAPQRVTIAKDVPQSVPNLFVLVANERNETVVQLIINLITHALQCILYGTQEDFPIDEFVYRLFFEDEKVAICGSIMKSIARQCGDCLTPDLSPFILFASCFEEDSKEFSILIRDEIPLSVQVNSHPQKFIDFAFTRGITASKALYKPIGAKMLVKVVSSMSNETKNKISIELINKILSVLSGRLFPFKECLIEAISELVGNFTVTKELVDQLEAFAMRPKSVFRAAAIDCLRKIDSTSSYNINKENLLKIMIDAIVNGATVAQVSAANCASLIKENNEKGFQEFILKTYEKMNTVEFENAESFCKMVLSLPEHQIPDLFDKTRFLKLVASSKEKTANVEKFLNRIV